MPAPLDADVRRHADAMPAPRGLSSPVAGPFFLGFSPVSGKP